MLNTLRWYTKIDPSIQWLYCRLTNQNIGAREVLKCGFLCIFLRYNVVFYTDLRKQLYLTNYPIKNSHVSTHVILTWFSKILNKEKQNFPIWWEIVINEVCLVDATEKSHACVNSCFLMYIARCQFLWGSSDCKPSSGQRAVL